MSVVAVLLSQQSHGGELDITERKLKKIEKDMLTAHVMLDFSTLAQIYSDDYLYIDDDGSIFTKSQVVELVKLASFRVDSIPVSNSRVRSFGNTAVITGIRKFYRGGKLLATVRYTEVWANRNRRWQCVSGQVTPFQEKQ